ncbi:glutamate 5-kinase [Candidatus Saganbacteria bacterium]|uniref:Glutamate 5-kinase n=1 Tax=Candidatus Saganbacteria bacterium TaxID=2575572 RepID=A0A9D6UJZ3_UNCSA|nr:glutamate 5-kinase [Candidatus Saganbacteria bacterium]
MNNTIVVKIGSSTLTGEKGKLDLSAFKRLTAEIAEIIQQKKKVIIVTSGAVAAGAERLGLGKPKTIPEKQAAAAVGQSILMRQYEKFLEEHGIPVAQILLTRDAIADRGRYLNARNCLFTLLREGVVPIVNENDTVAVDEIKIGDNDNLAALTASLVGADLLIMLTDIDGFYMKNEEGVPYLVSEIKEINRAIREAAGHPSSQLGTGGMITKIQAAEICSNAGVRMAIINGKKAGLIQAVAAGEKAGTFFYPRTTKLESRKRWLAYGLKKAGTIVIDAGAESALIKHGRSLLPVGIIKIKGKFPAGALVSVADEGEKEFARGLTNLSSEELLKALGKKGAGEAIHRDNLVIL